MESLEAFCKLVRKDLPFNWDYNVIGLLSYMYLIWGDSFPQKDLMTERLTFGTTLTGTLGRTGFWPTEMKKAC